MNDFRTERRRMKKLIKEGKLVHESNMARNMDYMQKAKVNMDRDGRSY